VPRFVACPDAGALAREAAHRFVARAQEAVAARGRFLVALAGGSTPRGAYELLAGDVFAPRVDWARVHVFWGDERCVPPDHTDSNYRMAREALLDRIPISAGNVHRMRGELVPEAAADAYEAELDEVLGAEGRFDLVLLGMGVDGHTASLFPGTQALEERERRVAAYYVEKLGAWRVTLTLPALNAARRVLFLVGGAGKRDALNRVRAGEPLPAALVRPEEGEVTWLVEKQPPAGAAHPAGDLVIPPLYRIVGMLFVPHRGQLLRALAHRSRR
jgi:6-phosphogluconolactonase